MQDCIFILRRSPDSFIQILLVRPKGDASDCGFKVELMFTVFGAIVDGISRDMINKTLFLSRLFDFHIAIDSLWNVVQYKTTVAFIGWIAKQIRRQNLNSLKTACCSIAMSFHVNTLFTLQFRHMKTWLCHFLIILGKHLSVRGPGD